MQTLVRTVFRKLSTLNIDEEEERVKARESEEAEGELKMSVQSALPLPEPAEAPAETGSVPVEGVEQPESSEEEQKPEVLVQEEGQPAGPSEEVVQELPRPLGDTLAPLEATTPLPSPMPVFNFQRSECEYLSRLAKRRDLSTSQMGWAPCFLSSASLLASSIQTISSTLTRRA